MSERYYLATLRTLRRWGVLNFQARPLMAEEQWSELVREWVERGSQYRPKQGKPGRFAPLVERHLTWR